jgi:hypothetical protein
MIPPTAISSLPDSEETESPLASECPACALSDSRIRWAFWIIGTLLGAILTYTTRHYVNGDAIAYFDMAEAFRRGIWPDVVNLTYAPGYSILLGLARSVLPDVPEVFVAKGLNFVCFLAAMAACDLFVIHIRTEILGDSYSFARDVKARERSSQSSSASKGKECKSSLSLGEGQGESPKCEVNGAPAFFSAICYSAFLLAALVWVKVQVVAPDLAVFCFVLLCCVVVLKMQSDSASYFDFGLLGLFNGLGYLFKTFFFPFSAIFYLLAALCCGSVRRAIPRLILGAGVMLLVAAPLLIAQSLRVGRVSFGESGNYNYAQFVAGRGESIHKPRVIHEKPAVLGYEYGTITSYPRGNDPAYWGIGIKPALNIRAQVSALRESLNHLFGRIFLPTAAILLWFCIQWRRHGLSRSRLVPPSPWIILLVVSLAGTLMYCLVVMEIRYVGSFIFLGFVALALLPRSCCDGSKNRFRGNIEAGLLVAFFLGTVIHSMVDQTVRDYYTLGGKISHRELLKEAEAVSRFLESHGLKNSDTVAIVRPFHDRLTWAKSAGVRITAEIPDADEFLKEGSSQRLAALNALKFDGFKAVVANDRSFASIMNEGWLKVPGTTNYFMIVLNGGRGTH